MSDVVLAAHHHGKSHVRLGRVWRLGSEHVFVEYNVFTMLDSDMEHAFRTPSNEGMTATDTQKNTVYYVAKQFAAPVGPEQFGLALAKQFVDVYPKVWKAKVRVEMKPWQRLSVQGVPHEHGFVMSGSETRTAFCTYDNQGVGEVTAGLKGLTVLKTTQSGYAGFLHDGLTTLADTSERMMATTLTCTWRYSRLPADFDQAYEAAKQAVMSQFFGPPKGGVFSPSVQFTIFQCARELLARVPEASSVFINAPNLHCIPASTPKTTFDNDVYVVTSEPHGNIEAVVTREQAQPHCRL